MYNEEQKNGIIGKNTGISIAIVIALMYGMFFLGTRLSQIDENEASIMRVEGDIKEIKSDIRAVRDLIVQDGNSVNKNAR